MCLWRNDHEATSILPSRVAYLQSRAATMKIAVTFTFADDERRLMRDFGSGLADRGEIETFIRAAVDRAIRQRRKGYNADREIRELRIIVKDQLAHIRNLEGQLRPMLGNTLTINGEPLPDVEQEAMW